MFSFYISLSNININRRNTIMKMNQSTSINKINTFIISTKNWPSNDSLWPLYISNKMQIIHADQFTFKFHPRLDPSVSTNIIRLCKTEIQRPFPTRKSFKWTDCYSVLAFNELNLEYKQEFLINKKCITTWFGIAIP